MSRTILYQTLEDRDNSDYILAHGPFNCVRKDAWLSEGYYFWDGIINNARWWGTHCYKEKGSDYIILKIEGDFDRDKCLDLVGNTIQIELFNSLINEFNEKFPDKKENITVSRIIYHFRFIFKNFPFNSIRACPRQTRKDNSQFSDSIKMISNKPYSIDLTPPIQLCVFDMSSISHKDYEIVH